MAKKMPVEELYRIWEAFILDKGTSKNILIREVVDSWKRCKAMKVNPWAKPPEIKREKNARLLSDNKAFLEVVHPFVNILDSMIQDTGFIVVLTDHRGIVLEMKGDAEAVNRAKENNFDIGADRSESNVGTNAICLALIEKKPIQIVGSEHYNQHNHDWTCSAAPIFDASGNLRGVLNLSGHYTLIHKHTLGMVVSLTKAIEREYWIIEKNRSLKLANQNLKAVIDSISEGVIAVDKNGIITALNLRLQNILHIPQTKACGMHVNKIFGESSLLVDAIATNKEHFDHEDVVVAGERRLPFVTTVRQIKDENEQTAGLVGILREKKDVIRMVNKITGAKANFVFDDIIYVSEQMGQLIDTARTVAEGDSRVLLEGESGTGKELLAQAIHNASQRKDGPFIAVNCSAIPRELIESELFGYSEGAFTGAKKGGNPGKFELADGGTLFLDEINCMPLEMQTKLLRVLQQNEITRVGGNRPIPINVRIIAASNQCLDDLVKEGHFRLDLYFRIGVVVLKIPALRDRALDIPILFSHLLTKICNRAGKHIKYDPEMLMPYICAYEWPGNVRELENYIERAIVLARCENITLKDFPAKIAAQDIQTTAAANTLAQTEKEAIEKALANCGGNISKASKSLGICRNTLYRRIKEYNIKI